MPPFVSNGFNSSFPKYSRIPPSLEKYFLACVIPYMSSVNDCINFLFINKKCNDVLLMLHKNPLFLPPYSQITQNSQLNKRDSVTNFIIGQQKERLPFDCHSFFKEIHIFPNIQTIRIPYTFLQYSHKVFNQIDNIEICLGLDSYSKNITINEKLCIQPIVEKIVSIELKNAFPLNLLSQCTRLTRLKYAPLLIKETTLQPLRILKYLYLIDSNGYNTVPLEIVKPLSHLDYTKTKVIIETLACNIPKIRTQLLQNKSIQVTFTNSCISDQDVNIIGYKYQQVDPSKITNQQHRVILKKYFPANVVLHQSVSITRPKFFDLSELQFVNLTITETKIAHIYVLPHLQSLTISKNAQIRNLETLGLKQLTFTNDVDCLLTLPTTLTALTLPGDSILFINNISTLPLKRLSSKNIPQSTVLPSTLTYLKTFVTATSLSITKLANLRVFKRYGKRESEKFVFPTQLTRLEMNENPDRPKSIVFPQSLQHLHMNYFIPISTNLRTIVVDYHGGSHSVEFSKFSQLRDLELNNLTKRVLSDFPPSLTHLKINGIQSASLKFNVNDRLRYLELSNGYVESVILPKGLVAIDSRECKCSPNALKTICSHQQLKVFLITQELPFSNESLQFCINPSIFKQQLSPPAIQHSYPPMGQYNPPMGQYNPPMGQYNPIITSIRNPHAFDNSEGIEFDESSSSSSSYDSNDPNGLRHHHGKMTKGLYYFLNYNEYYEGPSGDDTFYSGTDDTSDDSVSLQPTRNFVTPQRQQYYTIHDPIPPPPITVNKQPRKSLNADNPIVISDDSTDNGSP
ncbi:Uncharacterized protein QTN25_007888 [Entamoeba marina]